MSSEDLGKVLKTASAKKEDAFEVAAAQAMRKLSKRKQQKLEVRQYIAEKAESEDPSCAHLKRKDYVERSVQLKRRKAELKRARQKLGKRTHEAREARKRMRNQIKKIETQLEQLTSNKNKDGDVDFDAAFVESDAEMN